MHGLEGRQAALVSSKSSHIQTQMGGSHVINHPHLAFIGIYFMGRASSIWGDLYGVLDCNLHLGWVNTYDTQIWRMNIRLDPLFGWNWQFFTHLEAWRYTETFPWQLPPFFACRQGSTRFCSGRSHKIAWRVQDLKYRHRQTFSPERTTQRCAFNDLNGSW